MTDSPPEPGRLAGGITRNALQRDAVREAMRARHPDVPLLEDDELRASMQGLLAHPPVAADDVDGVWLFGYGSLLWNPCVEVVERRAAHLHGYHRDFRLRLTYGRGSPDAPGLMLGLVPGGSCKGVALRVPGRHLQRELLLVWRREMLTGVYEPRWIRLRTPTGPVPAIAFVVNPRHRCYCGSLDERTTVELLATGHGLIGSAADYLEKTVAHLDEQGIHDRRLRRLRARVAARRGIRP